MRCHSCRAEVLPEKKYCEKCRKKRLEAVKRYQKTEKYLTRKKRLTFKYVK